MSGNSYRWVLAFVGSAVVASVVPAARAEQAIPVSLAGVVNANLRSWHNGHAYPSAPTTVEIGSVSFEIAPSPAGASNTFGINTWDGVNQTRILTNQIFETTRVYTIINSSWGANGANNGHIDFIGANGVTHSVDLIQGHNIRDHATTHYNITLTDPTVVERPYGSGVRLDRQVFDIPADVGAHLQRIQIVDVNAGQPQGAAFIAAITVVGYRGGDANRDDRIDFDDLLTLAQNYNQPSGGAWSLGDFDGDGTVSFTDLLTLAQNYGIGSSAASVDFDGDWALAQSLVPEPGIAAVSLMSLTALSRRRR